MKKVIAFIMATMMMAAVVTGCSSDKEGTSSVSSKEGTSSVAGEAKELKVGVCLYKFDDTYISTVRQNLEKIQNGEGKGKVKFDFVDGKGDQNVQSDSIETLLEKDYDLLMVNLVNIGAAQTVVDKIKDSGVPVVFFNREPDPAVVKSYNKAMFIGTNAKEAGILQGNILAKAWETDKATIDRNKDDKLQYVMLKGEPDNPEAIARTEYSVSTLEDKGVKTEQLELQVCDWEQNKAQNAMEAWWAKSGEKIEAVIANNDGMAQGAIAALQAQGYNNGDKAKTIPVVGVDATKAAQDLIDKGFMLGSVLQDAEGMAKALYACGSNLANSKGAIDGTEYKFDETGVAVRIPYQEFVKK